MNYLDLRAQLEQEALWRDRELRSLKNALTAQGLTEKDPLYCRTMVVMTYAHVEGFVKQSLGIYVDMLNAGGYTCGALAEQLAASTLIDEMKQLRNPVVSLTATAVDLESKLQKQAEREVELVRRVRTRDAEVAYLDADELTSTDSNLSPAVLRRNLFRLGLDPDALSPHHNGLSFLLRTRNDVAHGKKTDSINVGEFKAAMDAARELMNSLPRVLYSACRWGKFLRPAAVI